MAQVVQSTALLTRPTAEPDAPPARAGAVALDRALLRAGAVNQRFAPTLLRMALAVVYVWFGALKFTGASPVRTLIGATLPFISPDLAVPALGGVEIAIGLALAAGVLPRIVLLVMAGHLAGTFLTFVTAHELMWSASNPLMLTSDGEFVVKNLVLITAGLVLIAHCTPRAQHRGTA